MPKLTTIFDRTPFARYFGIAQLLLVVLLLTMLAACSNRASPRPTPGPQANLSQRCPTLPLPPSPLVDPARLLWEMTVVGMYGDCAGRQAARPR